MPRVHLNKAAAAQADEAFHAKHPELKGRALTDQPKDARLRAQWLALYQGFGGRVLPRRRPSGRKTSLSACLKSDLSFREVYVYLTEMAGGDPYGHVGMVVQQKDGSYVRYSQAARNPNLHGWDRWEYFSWWQRVEVRKKTFSKNTKPSQFVPGAKVIRIPTTKPEQVQAAVDQYITDATSYHVITNNCADFVNDVLNTVEDVSVWDKTVPKDYFQGLKETYPDCLIK